MLNYSRINQQLAQYKIAFDRSKKSIEWILDKLDNINIQIEPTDYLRLCHPRWIGNTVLHIIYSKPQLFDLVLSRDVDYTIKNQDDQTIIHLLIQYSGRCCIANQRNVLVVPGINTILSAHVTMKNPTNPCDSNGLSHFHVACMANHTEAVEFFLDNNVPIDHAINSDSPYLAGFTALHLAIRCCNSAATKILLQRGANIHLKNNERMTAVDMVMANYLKFANEFLLGFFDNTDLPKKYATEEIAKLMLKTISNNDIKITGFSTISCFHIACAMMDSSVAADLLPKEDINQSIKNESALWPGYTPMHFAACTNYKTAKILIEKGGDLLAKDAKGITPLELCIERYKMENIGDILSLNSVWKEILCSQNRNELFNFFFAIKDKERFTEYVNNSFPKAGRISVPASSPLWPGFTLIHLLGHFSKIFRSYYEPYKNPYGDENKHYLSMIEKLHDRNKKLISAQDSRGRTVLHLLFRIAIEKTDALLYRLRNKINFISDLVDDENLSLLHIACLRDDKDLVEKLVLASNKVKLAYKGKSIKNCIETGWTPLHVAVANNNVNVVKVLLKYGADVHSEDVNGVTPIHLLVLLNNNWYNWNSWDKTSNKISAILLAVPILKDCVVKDIGLSHLHAACLFENEDAINGLIDSGSDINLAITRNSQVADRSFELSNVMKYLGKTPLQMKPIKDPLERWLPYFELVNMGELKDFQENAILQKQAEADFGLTKLHVACFLKDVEYLRNLLKDKVDVNGKLSMNSSRYAGFTPLHAVIEAIGNIHMSYCVEAGNDIVELLLNNGADVMLINAKQQTPIHMAYHLYQKGGYIGYCSKEICLRYFPRVIMMLKAQKDFSINPACIKGVSHFHIACHMNETATVKKFLERGNLDINQPIDFFIESKPMSKSISGFTPLHMAVTSEKNYIQFSSQLETVDLLLKHGADPNFEDSFGNTALHLADRYEILERIQRCGADMNMINTNGSTPLGRFLIFGKVSDDNQIMNWLRCGCNYNTFNICTKEGYIGLSIAKIPSEKLQNFLKIVTINMPHTIQIDHKGRTAIHNVVSIDSFYSARLSISIGQYATLIEILAKTGCDIDSRDNLGRTALHMAAEFHNSKAISALLMVGADANIQDNNGKTALAYHSEQCDGHTYYEHVLKHCDALKILMVHVQKLQFCQLDVCQFDKSYTEKEHNSITNERFQEELQEIKNIKIGFDLPTLHSFMSETDIVADYPTMSQIKRDVIDEFFYEDKISSFREKFSEVAGLINLQYRKAVMRSPLIDDAKTSLNYLANFQIPDLCSHMIIGFLSNTDLKNAIASSNNFMSSIQNSKITSPDESLSQNKKLRIR